MNRTASFQKIREEGIFSLSVRTGVTLIELLVVSGIVTYMLGGLYSVFTTSQASFSSYEAKVNSHREVRKAIMAMAKELRMAENVSILDQIDTSSITFTRPTLGTITYSWNSTGPNAKQIIRQTPGQTRIIANNISALNFPNSTPTSKTITIDVTATVKSKQGRTVSYNIKQKVTKR